MSKEFEYYKIGRSNDNNIPLIEESSDCPDYLYEEGPIENPKLMLFELGDPIPRKPKMADYHASPNAVVSKKIFDILSPLKIEGIQLLPATISVKDKTLKDYWAIHIYHHIQCVDLELSECAVKSTRLSRVKKLVLDKKVLEKIPLQKRLIFRLKEDISYELFHVSIMESIMGANPEGIHFTNIEQVNERALFQS
jgi:hypothetical protein